MKRSIILVLVYYLMQVLGTVLASVIIMVQNYFRTGQWIFSLSEGSVALSLIMGFVLMVPVLWALGYLKPARQLWDTLTPASLGWTVLLGASGIYLVICLSDLLSFMPNWLEDSFQLLESDFWGNMGVALLGPILEEMLFRGAVTRELLARYTPARAILFSGIIFGVFHINPAQVLPAMLIGFVLAWLFYRTRSLIPGIIIHVMNNSLSVLLSAFFPESEESFSQLVTIPGEVIGLLIAIPLFIYAFKQLDKLHPAPAVVKEQPIVVVEDSQIEDAQIVEEPSVEKPSVEETE